MAATHHYMTRSNPRAQEMLAQTRIEAAKEAAAGNEQLASLQSAWKATAWKVAKVSALSCIAGALLLSCFNTQMSTHKTFLFNEVYGMQQGSVYVSGLVHELAKNYSNLSCQVGREAVELVDCYALGLAQFFVKR